MPSESSNNHHPNGRTTASNNKNNSTNSPSKTLNNSIYCRPGRPKHAWLQEFTAGFSIYCACIILPSLPRYIYLLCVWMESWARSVGEKILWYIWLIYRFSVLLMAKWGWIVDPFVKQSREENGVGGTATGRRIRVKKFLRKYLFSTSTASLWEEFNQQQIRKASSNPPSVSPTLYAWGFGRSSSTHPAITMVMRDLQILTMLAVPLAMIRIWFVHMLVPEYLAPRKLEALTRCKSSHLLSSSSYKFGGVAGWEKATERLNSNGESDEADAANRGLYDRLLMRVSYHWHR